MLPDVGLVSSKSTMSSTSSAALKKARQSNINNNSLKKNLYLLIRRDNADFFKVN